MVVGLLVLAVPATAWVGAAYEWFFADCDAWDCGDRARSWLLLVVATAPLVPFGAQLAAGRSRAPAGLTRVMRALCSSVAALFGLLGFALLVAATGVTEVGDEESSLWLPFGLYFVGVAALLAVVLRRLRA